MAGFRDMLWLKAFHVIFLVTWFAGLFYLPRLFVYHVESDDAGVCAQFAVMERRLFVIMTIGGGLTAATGFWLLFDYAWSAYAGMGWLHVKLVLVTLLAGYHVWCYKLMRDLARDRCTHGSRWMRLFNEIPSLFLVAIVILAVVKPF